MSVTLYDVAKAAGVDPSSVSYALSGKGTLSSATRAKIIACAQELGYRPNLVARSLVTQRTQTIGLIVADISNPFYGAVTQAVERTAYRSEYRVLFVNTDRNEKLGRELLADLVARRVDGLIAMQGGLPAETVRSTIASGLPIVWCMWEDEQHDLTPAVDLDYFTGGRLVAKHLLALGHRRIAIVTQQPRSGHTQPEHRLRLAGCRAALSAAGHPLDDALLCFGDSTVESGLVAGHSLLRRPDPPTAIFATNDLMALGVLGVARDLGIAVPAALSIVGFDDILGAAYTGPPLTTIHVDVEGIMTTATTLLLDLIAGKEALSRSLSVPTLIVRGSTGPCPHPL